MEKNPSPTPRPPPTPLKKNLLRKKIKPPWAHDLAFPLAPCNFSSRKSSSPFLAWANYPLERTPHLLEEWQLDGFRMEILARGNQPTNQWEVVSWSEEGVFRVFFGGLKIVSFNKLFPPKKFVTCTNSYHLFIATCIKSTPKLMELWVTCNNVIVSKFLGTCNNG